MASDSIIMNHVAPALGVIVACMLFASPIKAVRAVRLQHQLGVSATAPGTSQKLCLAFAMPEPVAPSLHFEDSPEANKRPCHLTSLAHHLAALLSQSLNPLPYVPMWANCVAWLVYAFLIADPYVLASNVPGVLIASYMTISCYGYADDRVGQPGREPCAAVLISSSIAMVSSKPC